MSIQEISSNFKQLLKGKDVLTAGIVLFVGIGSFILGKTWEAPPETSIIHRESATVVTATEPEDIPPSLEQEKTPVLQVQTAAAALPVEGGYVASKNGTKYHLPWCSGAKRILEENKVWFETKEAALAAGYTPAANCPGL